MQRLLLSVYMAFNTLGHIWSQDAVFVPLGFLFRECEGQMRPQDGPSGARKRCFPAGGGLTLGMSPSAALFAATEVREGTAFAAQGFSAWLVLGKSLTHKV